MKPPNSIFTLSLLLGTVQLLAAPPAYAQLLTRPRAEAQGPVPGIGAFETPAEQENDLTKSLNTLLAALHDFSATYNSGHVINVKKAKAVRKAWEELEKSGWFKTDKSK